jgi:hypothetical protein
VVVHLTFFNVTYTVRTAPDIAFNRCLQLFVCYYKQNVYRINEFPLYHQAVFIFNILLGKLICIGTWWSTNCDCGANESGLDSHLLLMQQLCSLGKQLKQGMGGQGMSKQANSTNSNISSYLLSIPTPIRPSSVSVPWYHMNLNSN